VTGAAGPERVDARSWPRVTGMLAHIAEGARPLSEIDARRAGRGNRRDDAWSRPSLGDERHQ
jgi:hypothetical protein